eukprot:c1615_g1_i2.p2 GENE.c1615_g1_i2~~c1615_g1_i2.p2  ORF type:complete len:118 (+),score=15.85 c1615_g1_i2:113-466(+)
MLTAALRSVVGPSRAAGWTALARARPRVVAWAWLSDAPAGRRLITKEELAKHNNTDDCWVAIDGKVYDVSDYVYEHPGGEIIADDAGRDSTAGFNKAEHSPEAKLQMRRYYIGDLAP